MTSLKTVMSSFIIINIVVFVLITSLLFHPLVVALNNSHSLLTFQKSQLLIKEQNLSLHEYNNHLLTATLDDENRLLLIPYNQLADLLAEITLLAESLGLLERDFFTGEPVIQDDYYHIRITSSYSGSFDNVYLFVEVLSEMPCYIDQLSITPNLPEAVIWIQLSCYALDLNPE